MSLRRLAYTSQATVPFNKRALLDLLHDARAFNSLDQISGLLMHSQGHFLQILEGEPEAIDDLLARLSRDPRHSTPKIILDGPAGSRLFSQWSMGCADFDDPALSLLPGIRTDLADPAVIEDLISRLPEISDTLHALLD